MNNDFKKFWIPTPDWDGDYVIGAVLGSVVDRLVKLNLHRELNDEEREWILNELMDNQDSMYDWVVESIENALEVKFPSTINVSCE